jgi:hypothetical protein
MSRNHYIALAAVLAGEMGLATHKNATETVTVLNNLTRSIADVLKQDNGDFDRQRFYDAVGGGLVA